jgi:hypothetical protein
MTSSWAYTTRWSTMGWRPPDPTLRHFPPDARSVRQVTWLWGYETWKSHTQIEGYSENIGWLCWNSFRLYCTHSTQLCTQALRSVTLLQTIGFPASEAQEGVQSKRTDDTFVAPSFWWEFSCSASGRTTLQKIYMGKLNLCSNRGTLVWVLRSRVKNNLYSLIVWTEILLHHRQLQLLYIYYICLVKCLKKENPKSTVTITNYPSTIKITISYPQQVKISTTDQRLEFSRTVSIQSNLYCKIIAVVCFSNRLLFFLVDNNNLPIATPSPNLGESRSISRETWFGRNAHLLPGGNTLSSFNLKLNTNFNITIIRTKTLPLFRVVVTRLSQIIGVGCVVVITRKHVILKDHPKQPVW